MLPCAITSYVVAGVLEEVRGYYSLDDSLAGLIQTLFVVSYMITAPIFGYLGDRYNRTYIIAAGISFWSVTTLLGSFIPRDKFGWFLFLRAMVGVGEASYSTIAPTIIADLFSEAHRSFGLAFFYFAIPLGSGSGYMVGSSVAKALGGWQWGLRVTPGLGILSVVAALLLLVHPQRGHAEGAQAQNATSLTHDLKALAHNRTLIWNILGFSCVSFSLGALAWWGPSFMKRALELRSGDDDLVGPSQVDLVFGGIACISGVLGVLLGGVLAPRWKKHQARADAYICTIAIMGSAPLIALSLFYAHKMPNVTWTVVVPNQRSLAEAVHIMVSHLLGDAVSPYIVGAVSLFTSQPLTQLLP
ncbi:SPNS3 [Cordylochernes scorpioides]|uniref:SPNS3 n=1 Tax=Cordylochernes scorpioides TaxID=51811 RepID=A0ABY6K0Y1_9ARAC|nr:SPNS3 [Cordylochernes scorpioides]